MLPRIERYEITEELGHGGMATVYRARDRRLDRWVAVKVMHPHLRGTEQARARFSREARAVAKLKHRAILEIYDYSDNDSENAYIATELLTGPTLKVFVEGLPEVPPEIAACIGVELALALSAAHENGIVHRDVKPENVLLHERRFVKLTDFGIADMLDPNVSAMTATGQILGSPSHMAPEQVEGGHADARSDIFALGTILYWMATGNLPFPGKNPHQVLKRVVECNPIDPLQARPAIGRPLQHVIMRCLAKEPADRYPSASDLAAALIALLHEVGIDDSQAELESFLSDPAVETERLKAQILARLIAEARICVQRRDRMAAIDRLDRVLAIDDGNAQALSLVRALDQSSRKRLALRSGLAVCALSACAALWIAFAPKSIAVSLRPQPHPQAVSTTERPSSRPPAVLAKPAVPVPGDTDKGLQLADQPDKRPTRLRPRPMLSGPRTVVFDPEPANVTISVDGAAPRPFGPSFRMLDLASGKHTFRFVGAHGCCDDRELSVEIPPGPGQTRVSVKLPFRAAGLYIVSNVPADVDVARGLVLGRTRALLSVPITRALTENQQISVTAPGREPYTGSVLLRAGQVTQHQVDLPVKDSLPSAPR